MNFDISLYLSNQAVFSSTYAKSHYKNLNILHSAERCISPIFLFSSPHFLVSPPPFFRNMQPHSPMQPSWHQPSRENTRFYNDALVSGRLKTINPKPWKPITIRNCALSTECVLIDIIVTISTAVGTGCNFPHGEVGTTSHQIKTYDNRLTTS